MVKEAEQTRIFQRALPEKLFDDAKSVAEALSHCPNYWVPRDVIESGKGVTPAENVVTALFDIVSQFLPEDWAGAEYWVQIYNGGRGLAFHFDKDEHAMKEEGLMVNPIFSSVLYLTQATVGQGPQSPTVVTDQLFDHEQGCAVPDDPSASTLVFPVANSYCLFDGCLGHGVLDSGRKEERATLLVNWWRQKPENVERVEGVEQHQAAENGGEGERENDRAQNGTIVEEQEPQQQLECLYPEVISVTEAELGEEGMLMVDDLLESRGKVIPGDNALQAITISHPGLSLYPLDNEQLAQCGGEISVGAALLPLMEDEEESSSNSSSGSDESE